MIIDIDMLAIMTLLSALGFIGNSYVHFARSEGWPIGNSFGGDRFTFINASVVFVPVSFVLIWYQFGIWFAIGVLAAGFLLAWILTLVLRQYVQLFWFFAFAGLILYGVVLTARKMLA